ncbi:hypothetical protein [Mumia sp.]|uniref:hypothetical protein n=1 Tax=Mumia sp. TaxID=1965300 RepID=UPI0026359404|nr:hypothetical protein [Mumia sp.]MDD9348761.1 hypothetical protein [Mumia sp.]
MTGDGGRSFDFDVRESPLEVVATSPVVVTGTIASWERGVDAYDDEDAQRWAILAVDVDQAYVRAPGVHGAKVFVRVLRGYEVVGPDGSPTREPGAPSSVLTVDELEQAAPPGVRIAVMGTTASRTPHADDPTWRHENVNAGLPGGAVVTQPDVQGLILEDESGDLVSGVIDDDPATWGPGWRPSAAGSAARGSTAFDWLTAQLDDAT